MVFSLLLSALLGLIPANIAKKKGRSFGLWWLYGFLLFIIALIHALVMKDKSQKCASAYTGIEDDAALRNEAGFYDNNGMGDDFQ
jgi:hypothetical protein